LLSYTAPPRLIPRDELNPTLGNNRPHRTRDSRARTRRLVTFATFRESVARCRVTR